MNSNLLRKYIRVLLESDHQQSPEETLKNTDILALLSDAQEDPEAFLELYYTDRFEKIKIGFKSDAAAKIIACLRKGLSMIGIGSSRVVFEYDKKSVIKISINDAGVVQNELEHTASSDPMVGPIIARVLKNDGDFQWIVSEKVRPISGEAEFTLLSGIEHKNFKDEILALSSRGMEESQDKDKTKTKIINNHSTIPLMPHNDFISSIKQGKGCLSGKEFLNDVKAFLTRYKKNATTGSKTDFFVGDIYKYDSWGVNDSGCLVLFDFGTTNSTYNKFFNSGSFSDTKATAAAVTDKERAAEYNKTRITRLPMNGVTGNQL